MWAITYQVNWGTRFPRTNRHFYTTREPTKDEAIQVLREHGIPADLDWFARRNSGLLEIAPIAVEF